MKEQAIQKINQIGKISSILTLIAKILVGIGIICAIIGAGICFAIPKDLVDITTAGTMTLDFDFSSVGITIPEEDRDIAIEELKKELTADEEDFKALDVSLDEQSLQMSGVMEEVSFTVRDGAWAVVMAVIMLIMTFVTLCFVGALCKAFRDCESPFEENVTKKMNHLAISLIPWCIVSSVADSVFDSIVNRKPSISISLDLGVALVVLIVLVLVYIFKYGAVLQQESDETL